MGCPSLASRTSTLAEYNLSLLVSSAGGDELDGSLAHTAEAPIRQEKTKARRSFMNECLRIAARFITRLGASCQTSQRINGLGDDPAPTNGVRTTSSGHLARNFRALVLLERPHPGVGASRGEELRVGPALDDAAAFEDQDLVRTHDRRQAMSDGER